MLMVPPPPPALAEDLPYGTVLAVGLFYSTVVADFDFETYSEAGMTYHPNVDPVTGIDSGKWAGEPGAPQGKKGLGVCGAARYMEHPSFRVVSLSYNLKDGRGTRAWLPGTPLPLDLFAHFSAGLLIEAWNVGFERYAWRRCMGLYGFPPLPASQLRCAMAKSRAHCYPGALALAAKVMRSPVLKDADGDRLIKKFCVPRNPTKKDQRRSVRLEDDPKDAVKLIGYNVTDIRAEAEASRRCPDLTGRELEFWQADQAINSRGVKIDVEGVGNCIAVLEQAFARYDAELYSLTGGAVARASELARLTEWLKTRGVFTASLDEDAISDLLKERSRYDPDAVRALEIRQLVGSASVKKVFAMRNSVCADGRLRDLFVYHGARTGRPTGEGAQPTNLPRKGCKVARCAPCGKLYGFTRATCPWCGAVQPPPSAKRSEDWGIEAAELVLGVLKARSLAALQHYFVDAMPAIAGVLRSLFIAEDGHILMCSDFSAIEAVVLAALAGEQWRLEVFRTHGKIYELSAAKILNIPFESFAEYKKLHGQNHPARQSVGKVAELALGFGGWIGAWRNFDGPGTDDEIKAHILNWRAASPHIEYFWGGQPGKRVPEAIRPMLPLSAYRVGSNAAAYFTEYFGLEGMAVLAILNPGREYPVMRLDGTFSGIRYVMVGAALVCLLPSGRPITYHNVRLFEQSESWRGKGIEFEGYNTNPKAGPLGWVTMLTYSGKLAENVTQATARDWQREAIINLEQNGYPVVLHVYDEDVCEVPLNQGHSVPEMEALMMRAPSWGEGWPIKAVDGWEGFRYRKA